MRPPAGSQAAYQKCIASRIASLLKTSGRTMVYTKIDGLLGCEVLIPKTEGVVCEVSFLKLLLDRRFKTLPKAD